MKIEHFDLGQINLVSPSMKVFKHICEKGDVIINFGVTGYWDKRPPQIGDPIQLPAWSGIYIHPIINGLFHNLFCISSSHPSQMISASHSFLYKLEKDDCFEIELSCATSDFHPWNIRVFSVDLMYFRQDESICSVTMPKSTNNLVEPKNNDGRTSCFWCCGPLKNIQGFSNSYKICQNCGK